MNKLINDQIISKTINIFEKLFNLDIKPGEVYSGITENHDWDISGVVGVVGNFEGVVTIRLKDDLGTKLLEKSRLDSPNSERRWYIINDMVGEIINNIVGNILGEIGDKEIKNSVPITVQGLNHKIQWPDKSPINVIPFNMDYGTFVVQYSLAEK